MTELKRKVTRRTRGVWTLPIDAAFRYAVRAKAFHESTEKRRGKLTRKGGR